jgi:hypothetical protein
MKILLLLFTFNVYSADCSKHPVYCHIKRVAPHLSKDRAMKISNVIYRYAKKYNQDPHISVAIARQENVFRQSHRKGKVAVFSDHGYEVVEGSTDLCMFQIHINTAINHGYNIWKLHTDLEYCVETHFKILVRKKRICKKLEPYAWTCYHSFTPSIREAYRKKVEEYL